MMKSVLLTLTLIANCVCVRANSQDTGGQGKIGPAKEPIVNSIGMKLALIPSGEFLMGNSHSVDEEMRLFNTTSGEPVRKNDFANEYPRHRVRIERAFYLGVCPVTRGQFRQFVKETGFRTDAERSDPILGTGALDWGGQGGRFEWHGDWSWRKTGFVQTDDHPVVNVSWNDAIAFCKWLSRKDFSAYRLPTEAQWEYACRAGTTTRYSFGDDPSRLVEFANVADATARKAIPRWKFAVTGSDGYVFTSPVGQFRPNAFGLYDMHGNVAQWCMDWYDAHYVRTPEEDPARQISETEDLHSVLW